MSHAWQYLRLISFGSSEPHFEPPTAEYTLLCAAVLSALLDRQRGEDARSALLDKLGADGWDLVATSADGGKYPVLFIFKRELPDPT